MSDNHSDFHRDGLPPDNESQIEKGFDAAFDLTKVWALALLRYLKRLGITVGLILIAGYACDYIVLQFRSNPSEVVEIKRFYVVHLKSGRTEMTYGDSENETCVHSVFPHGGNNPCWYVRRHSTRQVDI